MPYPARAFGEVAEPPKCIACGYYTAAYSDGELCIPCQVNLPNYLERGFTQIASWLAPRNPHVQYLDWCRAHDIEA
jgi:hypothetical protein